MDRDTHSRRTDVCSSAGRGRERTIIDYYNGSSQSGSRRSGPGPLTLDEYHRSPPDLYLLSQDRVRSESDP